MKIIALSLWGSDQKYLRGIIENVRLGKEFYPGWAYVVYAHNEVPEGVLDAIWEAGVTEIAIRDGIPEREGLYWRMEDIFVHPEESAVIIRDADSRPSAREAACVREWLSSGKAVHTIRDHRCHTAPIMGGLWGAIPRLLNKELPAVAMSYGMRMDFVRSATEAEGKPKHGRMQFSDQDWLAVEVFHKLVRAQITVHDDRKFTGQDDLPLRVKAKSPMDFCGQVYSAEGVPFWKP